MVLKYNKPPSQRQLQVAENIRHVLAEFFIRGELNHPYFDNVMITVSEVRISPDLKIATAFLVLPIQSDKNEIIKVLRESSPHIRKAIAKRVQLRYLPEIRFALDESIERAAKINDLLK